MALYAGATMMHPPFTLTGCRRDESFVLAAWLALVCRQQIVAGAFKNNKSLTAEGAVELTRFDGHLTSRRLRQEGVHDQITQVAPGL